MNNDMAKEPQPKEVKSFKELVEHFKRSTSYKKRNGVHNAHSVNYKIEKKAGAFSDWMTASRHHQEAQPFQFYDTDENGEPIEGFGGFNELKGELGFQGAFMAAPTAWRAAVSTPYARIFGKTAPKIAPALYTALKSAPTWGARLSMLKNIKVPGIGAWAPIAAATSMLDYYTNSEKGESLSHYGQRKNDIQSNKMMINQDNSALRHVGDITYNALGAVGDIPGTWANITNVFSGESKNRRQAADENWRSSSDEYNMWNKKLNDLRSQGAKLKDNAKKPGTL